MVSILHYGLIINVLAKCLNAKGKSNKHYFCAHFRTKSELTNPLVHRTAHE